MSRILVTTSTFPVRDGDGVPRFVCDLAGALTAHADVLVLAPDAPDALKREQMGSLTVRRFSYFPWRRLQVLGLGYGMRDNLRRNWLARLQVPLFLAAQWLATRALIRTARVDVVNAHWLVPQGLTAAWARGRRASFKLVLHVHAGDVYLLHRLPFGSAIARYVVGRSDVVLADGTKVRDTLDELLGFASGTVIQPMGVHRHVFAPEEGAGLLGDGTDLDTRFQDGFVLFVGRLSEKKGAIYLIRAMHRVVARHPGLGLVVIGEGPEQERLRFEVRRLGLTDAVRFVGRQSHARIAAYLRQCRASVVPSVIDSHGEADGMPTVVLEALAAGVRVVGTTVGGIPDVLRHGENGWLCPPENPDALADQIFAALRDPTPSQVLVAALETARQHDWRQVARNYMRCLERLDAGP